jgi:hypothetical protein
MIRYTVVWDEAVEADYLNAWTNSGSQERAKLTEAANTIDRSLTVNAESMGQLQPDGATRAIVVEVSSASITVYFEALQEERQVLVFRLVFRRRE